MTGPNHETVRVFAAVALAGPLEIPRVIARWAVALTVRKRWLPALATRLVRHFGAGTRPRLQRVEQFLAADAGLQGFLAKGSISLGIEQRPPPVMCPATGRPETWPVLPFLTEGELAQWLRLSVPELAWFADRRGLGMKTREGPLQHYRYRWQPKRDGSARLIESPKLRLKLIQRGILNSILQVIPPHEAVHGFRRGRSTGTFVAPHVGRDMVLRLDLKDFFTSITRPRVLAVFLTAGYPEAVATALAGLCTHRTPRSVWRSGPGVGTSARRFELPHLPQGSPTSPALANLVAYRLDCRLSGLAQAVGARYTRYADDLVFSGGPEFVRSVGRFLISAGAIALEEGFEVNTHKTRVMRRGVSQRAAGLVVNDHPNIPRTEYDQLKAILHNCVRHGPSGQNRGHAPNFPAHLAGRVAYVTQFNPARGLRLKRLLDQIAWD